MTTTAQLTIPYIDLSPQSQTPTSPISNVVRRRMHTLLGIYYAHVTDMHIMW